MQSVPPGPEQDRLRAALEREARAFEQSLLDGPPFPVHGITSPLLTVAMVGSYGQCDGVLDLLELQYGTENGEHGPTASVTTAPVDEDGFCQLADDLALALETERFNASDGETPEAVHVEERRAVFLVDGVETPADVRVEDEWWAAVVTPPPAADCSSDEVRVLIVARGVPIEQVHVERVTDFAPYFEARRRWESLMRAQMEDEPYVDPADLDLPDVDGFEAHYALIERVVPPIIEMDRAHRENRRPPRPADDPEGWTRDWETATRTQMRLAGQDRPSATAAVSALVNQMIQLAIRTEWYGDEPDARAAAIEESVRWTVFGSEVPSREGQERWDESWAAKPTGPPLSFEDVDPDAVRREHTDRRMRERAWSKAWKAWYSARPR